MKKLKKLKKTNVFIHLNKRLGLLSQSKQVFFYVNCFVCLHSLFQNLYPVDMALSSFRIFLRVSTCWNLHSMIIIVINISAKYSFTILEINIRNFFFEWLPDTSSWNFVLAIASSFLKPPIIRQALRVVPIQLFQREFHDSTEYSHSIRPFVNSVFCTVRSYVVFDLL